jgi:hypothetical protein
MDSKEKAPPKISRADALAAGLKRFYTGRVCHAGHRAERYANSGVCCECAKERSRVSVRTHYGKHRTRILATKKVYYAQNKEAIKARVRARTNRLKQEQQAALAAV